MHIDLFHDTACPWCRIGKRHLQLALQQWEGELFCIRYRSFFLDPTIPAEGNDFRDYMSKKGAGQVPLQGWFDAPCEMGAAVGLTFHFERIQRAPSTLLSHRLIALSPDAQREAMVDAVYAAYFEHGQDIGQVEVLVNIASEQGLDPTTVRRQLLGDAALEQVLADVRWAQEKNIHHVPFFIVQDRLAFSGAQPPDSILSLLRRAAG